MKSKQDLESAKEFFFRGLEAILSENYRDAESAFLSSLELVPDRVSVLTNLAAAQIELLKFEDARSNAELALKLEPGNVEAMMNAALSHMKSGEADWASEIIANAVDIASNNPDVWCNQGLIFANAKKFELAENSYRRCLEISPSHLKALVNYGALLSELDRNIESEKVLKAAVTQSPSISDAYFNLGNLMMKLARFDEAKRYFLGGLELRPNNAFVRNNLGVLSSYIGDLHGAERNFREAFSIDPEYHLARSNLLFSLNYTASISPERSLAEAKEFGATVSKMTIPKFDDWAGIQSKLRVGVVSGDLRNHAVGFFAEGLFKNLDPSRFELHAFSATPKADELTERVRPYFSSWTVISDLKDKSAAYLIHKAGVHILIDMSGHSANNRLPIFAFKPSPIQISWLGYFATTGLPEMDYFVGDVYVSPASEAQHFTESIWNLPESSWCFTEPDLDVPTGQSPHVQNKYITFGFFGNLTKMNMSVIDVWAEILRKIPNSKLLVKSKQLADGTVRAGVVSSYDERGIPESRLVLEGPSSREEYLAAYNKVDIVLDTFPYPGGTTSADALWMGVPVLTLQGKNYMSRRGESIMQNIGHPEWIASDREAYVDNAVKLAMSPSLIQSTRSTLRERVLASPLFDQARFAEHFGNMLERMWERYSSEHL